MKQKIKGPLWKKWWFWVGIFILLVAMAQIGNDKRKKDEAKQAAAMSNTNQSQQTKSENKQVESEQKSEPKPEAKPEIHQQQPDQKQQPPQIQQPTADQIIKQKTEEIVSTLQTTSLKSITVNKNASSNAPDDYIVLVYLSFDAKNTAGTAKSMIDMYNNEIGARLADVSGANQLTIFWEVPYLKKEGNIAKASLVKQSNGMAFDEVWNDNNIFN